jgi:hypothetical protein
MPGLAHAHGASKRHLAGGGSSRHPPPDEVCTHSSSRGTVPYLGAAAAEGPSMPSDGPRAQRMDPHTDAERHHRDFVMECIRFEELCECSSCVVVKLTYDEDKEQWTANTRKQRLVFPYPAPVQKDAMLIYLARAEKMQHTQPLFSSTEAAGRRVFSKKAIKSAQGISHFPPSPWGGKEER